METLLRAQGACATNERSGWKLGWWSLDAAALRFHTNRSSPVVVARLARMLGVETGRRKFLVISKPVLVITYSPTASRQVRRCWLLTADVGGWQQQLSQWAPRRRFALEVVVETYVEPTEVVVVVYLPTSFRDDPPRVRSVSDGLGLELSTVDDQVRDIELPVAAARVLAVEVSSTGMMVVRLRRMFVEAGAEEERVSHGSG